jgi:hypothetical protein
MRRNAVPISILRRCAKQCFKINRPFSEETCCVDFQPSADVRKRRFKIEPGQGTSGVPLLEINTTFDERAPVCIAGKGIHSDERVPLLKIRTTFDERVPLLEIRTAFDEHPLHTVCIQKLDPHQLELFPGIITIGKFLLREL